MSNYLLVSDFKFMKALLASPPSILLSKLETSTKSYSAHYEKHPLIMSRHHQILDNKFTENGIRRSQRNRTGGILRLGVTDNINVLRARLLAELRRRQQQVRQKVKDRLDTIG